MTEDEIIRIIDNILQGLYWINSHGMMHRDIKSENVIKDGKDGDWKLGDYGLSCVLPKGMNDASIGEMTKGIGTPYYMSP